MSDTERTPDDDFVEAQEGDYEPEAVIHDPDDLPVDDEDDDRIVPDDERPVPLDPDDAEIA
ncbi:hypothetical protein [uncultured Leifsonia sp.]|jgi:hypothetical protein|uniref:hypothetical protein n=1 Tax=uncultured Leifsonia sp. TaxID=340359 RepID=UPI0025F90DFE|nr:hypothetical protein [uncultured Leifsonia sp.]